jgi:hypothetical protein
MLQITIAYQVELWEAHFNAVFISADIFAKAWWTGNNELTKHIGKVQYFLIVVRINGPSHVPRTICMEFGNWINIWLNGL